MRKQRGQIIRIGSRWHVRHWEGRNIGGIIERKRVRHFLGEVTTRGKRPPADIVTEAERHMATVTSGTIPADRIVTIGDFVEQIYLPWVREYKRTRLRTFSRPRRYTRPASFPSHTHARSCVPAAPLAAAAVPCLASSLSLR